MRYETADIAEAEGRYRAALEWRAIVARMRKEWRQRGWPDPDSLHPGLGGGPLFWHDNQRDGVVCGCGHFGEYLCDEPVGRGRTCDLVTCRCCRHVIGPELDQCDYHWRTQPREVRR
jgi:hypothetical protein